MGCNPIFEVLPTCFNECLYTSPAIWQSYINVILDCLQNRKYCETIMDDFFTVNP